MRSRNLRMNQDQNDKLIGNRLRNGRTVLFLRALVMVCLELFIVIVQNIP